MPSMTAKRTAIALATCLILAGCFKSSEERAAEHFESAIALLEAGDPKRALVEFRNVVRLDDGNVDARWQMANIQLDLNNTRAAYRNLLHVVERKPDDLEARITLSRLAFEARNWDEFKRHGKSAMELGPDLPDVQAISLGVSYQEAAVSQDQEARAELLKLAESQAIDNPDNSILRQLRIDSYVSDQRYSEALELLNQSIADTPDDLNLYTGKLELVARLGDEAKVEQILQDMVARFPDETSPKQMLLRYFVARDRLDEAETFLRELYASAKPKDRNGTFLSLVQFINRTKGGEAALATLQEAIQDEPNNGSWLALQASLKYDIGRQSEAVEELEALLASETVEMTSEERQNTQVILARVLRATGNEVAARQKVEEILAADPNVSEALKMQAVWLIREDNTSGAINALRTALEHAPEDADAMLLMARAYARAGNNDLRNNFLSLAVETSNSESRFALAYAEILIQEEKFLQAESILIASLRIAPGDEDVLKALGRVYIRLEDLARARQVAETLGQLETDSAQNAGNTLLAEVVAREVGNDQALVFLEQLAQQSDGDNVATLNFIRALLQTGKIDEATRAAREALEKTPDDLAVRNALALSLTMSRDFDGAEAQYRNILDAEPRASSVWIQLARVKSAQGDPQGSAAIIEEGLAANPDALDLLWGKASLVQNAGDINGAIAIYEQMYERNSNALVVANNLASLLATYKDDDASLERARALARRLKDTDVPALQDTYGWILVRTGEVDEAVNYLEPAAAALVTDPNVQFHLGMAYAGLNRTQDALAQMRKAITVAGPLADEDFTSKVQAQIKRLEEADTGQ